MMEAKLYFVAYKYEEYKNKIVLQSGPFSHLSDAIDAKNRCLRAEEFVIVKQTIEVEEI